RDIDREIFNVEHPATKFTVGNLDTLADREAHSVRDDMLAFYEQYYSSHLMNLVVLGSGSLDELESMVRSRFTAVKKRDITIDSSYRSEERRVGKECGAWRPATH